MQSYRNMMTKSVLMCSFSLDELSCLTDSFPQRHDDIIPFQKLSWVEQQIAQQEPERVIWPSALPGQLT